MAAPKGNTNSNKNNRLWADTIRRAVIQADGKALRDIADKLVEKAREGDMQAIKELGDRIDGKAIQQLVGAGNDGEHLFFTKIVREIVKPSGEIVKPSERTED